ncbi:hypothetical protein GE061_001608 [Apolygus lucorum]|uniref:Uncharacterized protein n=1 Tax=Apolygus lucorum TaxID=248454 RepID=A0A8S9Y9A2_APOLU|nr:hypothetical protein GE061_001608 [Apolygus lucorum]
MDCEFGPTLNEFVKNKFVTGLTNSRIIDLLCEEEHTKDLKHYVDLAFKKESATQEESTPLNALTSSTASWRKPGKRFGAVKAGGQPLAYSKTKGSSTGKVAYCYACKKPNHDFST